MGMESIKSYLISLGFEINEAEYNQAARTVNELGRVIQSSTAAMTKNFAVAGTAITAAFAGITASVAGLVTEVAKADLEYTKFANKMWTSKAAAKEMKMSMDALGESMEDIAFTPELRQQYGELIALGRQMNTPTDAGDQLKNIRSIMFEFKKLKLEVAYAMEWVAYYLGKYLGGPLTNIKKQLSDFNEKLTQTMPEWTKKIANVLAVFINIGTAGVRFVKGIYDGFNRLFDMLPKGFATVAKGVLALWAVLKFTPIGVLSLAFVGLLLLIEDFYGYLDGRKSSKTLAPIWDKILEWKDKFSKWSEDSLPDIKKKIEEVISVLEKLGRETLNTVLVSGTALFKELDKSMSETGTLTRLRMAISAIDKGFMSVSDGISNVMKQLGLLASDKKSRGFWSWISDQLTEIINKTAAYVKAIGGMADVVGLLMQGKFKEAGIRALSTSLMLATELKTAGDHQGLSGGDNAESFISAISGQESGGNYDAVNGRTGASGKYQIMPENWSSWSAQAGLPPTSPMTPENQEIVGRYKLTEYYNKYGARGAAIAWYAGEGAVDYSEYAKNRKQGNGDEPSMNEYANAVLSRMNANNVPSSSSPETQTSFRDSINNARDNYAMGQQNAAMAYQQRQPLNYNAGQTVINVGDINIGGTNVSAAEISRTVTDSITQAQERQIARNMRDVGGVFS